MIESGRNRSRRTTLVGSTWDADAALGLELAAVADLARLGYSQRPAYFAVAAPAGGGTSSTALMLGDIESVTSKPFTRTH
jgi:hypothetical protein